MPRSAFAASGEGAADGYDFTDRLPSMAAETGEAFVELSAKRGILQTTVDRRSNDAGAAPLVTSLFSSSSAGSRRRGWRRILAIGSRSPGGRGADERKRAGSARDDDEAVVPLDGELHRRRAAGAHADLSRERNLEGVAYDLVFCRPASALAM